MLLPLSYDTVILWQKVEESNPYRFQYPRVQTLFAPKRGTFCGGKSWTRTKGPFPVYGLATRCITSLPTYLNLVQEAGFEPTRTSRPAGYSRVPCRMGVSYIILNLVPNQGIEPCSDAYKATASPVMLVGLGVRGGNRNLVDRVAICRQPPLSRTYILVYICTLSLQCIHIKQYVVPRLGFEPRTYELKARYSNR